MKSLIAACVAALGLAAASGAWSACPTGLPPGISCGEKDAGLAPAGTYGLDPNHAAVIAKVSHLGYSMSVFRFDKVEGSLTWAPTAPEKSVLSVSVDVGSIATNVAGFAEELSGARYLNAVANPKATFVSAAFRPTNATHGQVDGQLTLNGKTRPQTFAVELLGAGKGFGKPRIGIEATTLINAADYGLPAMLGQVTLIADVEFEKKG